jgi:beta-lactamase class C
VQPEATAASPTAGAAPPSNAAVTPAGAAVAGEPSFANDARVMDQLAQQIVDHAHIPGMAMAIVQDGRVLVMRGYGVVDAHGTEPVTTDTVFRLASLSKGFAGTLAALPVHDGLMGWDMQIST